VIRYDVDDYPPEEVAGFLQEGYPAMTTIPECGRRLQEAGYAHVGSSRLPPEARREECYDPLEKDGGKEGEIAGQKPDAVSFSI
jgi:hypothetical protein